MRAKVARWGNSLALRLPKGIAVELGLEEDVTVDLEVRDGQLVVQAVRSCPTLEELLEGITPENRHEEVDWGPAVGREFA